MFDKRRGGASQFDKRHKSFQLFKVGVKEKKEKLKQKKQF